MAGICSAHNTDTPVDGCELCHASGRDLFSDWDEKVSAAEKAGKHRCAGCGFVFYRVTNYCPKCSLRRSDSDWGGLILMSFVAAVGVFIAIQLVMRMF